MKQIYAFVIAISLLLFGLFNFNPKDSNDALFGYEKKIIAKEKPKNPPKKKSGRFVLKSAVSDKITSENQVNKWFAPTAVTIVASKTVSVSGGGNAVPGSILQYTVSLSNSGTTDGTAVSFTDVLSSNLTLVAGTLKASPIGRNDAYNVIGNVGITVNAANGILTNDISPDNTTISISAASGSSTNGSYNLAADGSFTYNANAGFSGSDTFNYTVVSTNGTTGTGTVTLTVSTPIWFVNIAAGSSGTGTLANPFKDWSNFATANVGGAGKPDNNHFVFIYSGTYAGAATLRVGQKVLGKGATTSLATFAGVTVESYTNALPTTSDTKPNLTSIGTTISLTSSGNNTLRGFDMGNSTNYDISGTSFGTLTASEMILNGNGGSLNLATGAVSATFTSITSNTAFKPIALSNITGTLTSTNGVSLSSPSNTGIEIAGGSTLTANFGNTSITTSIGTGISITGGTGNTSIINFSDLDVACNSGAVAISTSHSGTLTCTSGTITTSNVRGIVLNGGSSVLKETLGVVLDSYSASGASKGLEILNTLGSFTINGTGTTDGSGGTISNISARGIELNNASNVTLKNMALTNANTTDGTITASDNTAANAAIFLITVAGLTLTNIDVSGTTTQVGLNLNACSNVVVSNSTFANCGTSLVTNEGGIVAMNLSGTSSITNTSVTVSGGRNVFIRNTNATTLILTVTGSTFATANDASNFLFEGNNTTNSTLTFKTNTFSNATSHGLDVNANNTSTINVQIGGPNIADKNTVTARTTTPGSDGIFVQGSGAPTVNYNIVNNDVQTSFNGYFPINVGGQGTGGQFMGRINNNTTSILNAIVPTSGMGIYVGAYGRVKHITEIKNNTVSNAGNYGIQAEANNNNTASADATMDATIQNNVVNMIAGGSGYSHYGLTANSLNAGSGNIVTCANTSGNTSNNTSALNLELSSNILGVLATNANIKIQGNFGALPAAWTTSNPAGGSTAINAGGGGTVTLSGAFTCLTPTNLAAARLAFEENNLVTEANIEAIVAEQKITPPNNEIIDENKNEALVIKENTPIFPKINKNISQNSVAAPQSGETITINGAGSGFLLPSNKSTTITFNASVALLPSSCTITNQASVSGSNFTTVNSNTTTTNLIIPPPTALNAATPICNGQSISLSATCSSGAVQWYNAAATGTLLGTGSPFVQSPTSNTTYQAGCLVGGCESVRINTGLITVNPLPIPAPTSNSPVCVGATLNLTGGGGGTYAWSGPNGFTSTNQSPSIANATVSATGTYTLTVTNAGCTASATTAVTVSTQPTATASSNSAICVGETLNFTGGGGGTYAWSGPNGFSSTAQNPSITNATVSATGTYILTITNAGCTASATTAVTLNALPTATASSNSAICVGATLNLTGGGGGTYAWSGPNGYSSTAQSPSITNATVSATGTYTLTVTNAGCTASATTAVTVNALPTATASSNSAICVGATLNLTGGGGGTYAWSGPNSFTSTAQSPSIANATVSASGTYILTVTNAGCTASATTAVTVSAQPTATASSNSAICVGATLNLTGGGGGAYAWSGPNGFSSTAQNPSITNATVSATGTYTLTVTNAGCTASATTAVTLNALPTATASSNSAICVGATLNLTGGGGGTYTWSGPNGYSSTAQSPSITNATVSATGTYTLTVTNANGCSASATTAVTINALPVPNPSSDSPKCIGSTLSFNSVAGMATYAWSGPNSFSSSIQAPSISSVTSAMVGTYTLTVTNANGCSASATVMVVINEVVTIVSNTGPYQVGNPIQLNATGGTSYAWSGPNSYVSTLANPTINNSLSINSGVYTVIVTRGLCSTTATTNVVVNGIDPCVQIMEYTYVKAGSPFQTLFPLVNGQSIVQTNYPVSIKVTPICNTVNIASVEMKIVGPFVNWTTLQSYEHFALFDNLDDMFNGQVFAPGTYTLTVTGYGQRFGFGGTIYGPVVTTFTIIGNDPTVSMPNVTGTEFCAGSNVAVDFATSGVFGVNNQFITILSDSSGSFNNNTQIIGSTTVVGSKLYPIPNTVTGGNNYKIKVISTEPASGNYTLVPIKIHPLNLNLVSPTNNFGSGVINKKATQSISASNKINSPALVNYQGGKSIILNAGFEARNGAVFKAEIGGCSN